MNKTPITIWVTVEEPAIENGKIIVKKGNFYYNGKKYLLENGEIRNANSEHPTLNNINTTQGF